jgi:hypothetical protein
VQSSRYCSDSYESNLCFDIKSKTSAAEWSEKGDYFTDWLILEQVAIALSGASKETRDSDPGYLRLRQLCDLYLNDPLGDNSTHPLSELTRQLITTANEDLVRQHLNEWINQNKESSVILTDQELKNVLVRLEFALLVAVFSNRLNSLLRDWKNVETPLKLEGESSLLFHTPPSDYEAIIPAAPMGNVLAFQYVKSTENGSGDLRFFKCLGVGRWLLLHLHELFASDGIVGPHVLLLSGTSWAGKAPGYHVQIPVAGVLHSPRQNCRQFKTAILNLWLCTTKKIVQLLSRVPKDTGARSPLKKYSIN